jgi:hypothetical protein
MTSLWLRALTSRICHASSAAIGVQAAPSQFATRMQGAFAPVSGWGCSEPLEVCHILEDKLTPRRPGPEEIA